MKDEDLLKALRGAARDEERAYNAWRSSEEGRASEAPRTHLVDVLVGRALTDVASPNPSAGSDPRATAAAPKRAWRSSRGRTIGACAALATAVAASVVFVRVPPQAPMPHYSVTFLSGTEALVRGVPSGGGPVVPRPGAPFELLLRPDARATPAIVVRAFILSGTRRVPLAVEASANSAGVAHVHGTWPGREAFATPGELVLAVARASDVPPQDQWELVPAKALRVVEVPLEPPPQSDPERPLSVPPGPEHGL